MTQPRTPTFTNNNVIREVSWSVRAPKVSTADIEDGLHERFSSKLIYIYISTARRTKPKSKLPVGDISPSISKSPSILVRTRWVPYFANTCPTALMAHGHVRGREWLSKERGRPLQDDKIHAVFNVAGFLGVANILVVCTFEPEATPTVIS